MTVEKKKLKGAENVPDGFWALFDDANFNHDDGWGECLIGDESVRRLADHGFNDRATSVVNKTKHALYLSRHGDTEILRAKIKAEDSASMRVEPGEQISNLKEPGLVGAISNLNDAISAVILDKP
ncbi:hypothetical protein [Streptomyces sp. CB01373]|uniref:hypothetical protein n=1 Tax=Streptomyces sp. CB01373 TaxID=2020325 RepID=UPI000C27C368|nr:hypothetical protein [Streptomyces sp. CB01373]PJM91493.1 hypothetical protein CG719_33520 [Streptomyces sp. CB01373]